MEIPGSMPCSATIREPLRANARTIRMVLYVWLSDTAAICTSGIDTGLPTHPPRTAGSKRSNRAGPHSSTRDSAATAGVFPVPLLRRLTPWWCSQLPDSSTAYHHKMNRAWRGVG